jgi:uracil-DNA glycosylase family 4
VAVVKHALDALHDEIVACRACPRLVAWRETVAATKRAAYRDAEYWGRPVPGFGDAAARIVVLGLAPAAHGANRTGRVFTGDRSGDWLFAALHRAGLANQPTSTHAGDGLRLDGVWITAAVRCAPPGNLPTPNERETCAPFLTRELALLRPRVVMCLGALAFTAACGHYGVRPRPRFGHGVETAAADGPVLLASYHPSQQNTFTGKLTEQMFDSVVARAKDIVGD